MASSKKPGKRAAAKPPKQHAIRRKPVRSTSSAVARAESEAQARLAAIVHSSEDAIISKDLDGIVTSWNRGAERLFGHTAEQAIGRPITLIIPPERHAEETSILQRIRSGEAVEHYETVRMRRDGTLVDISLTVSPIRGNAGRVIGASKIARDVSDRKRTDESLRSRERMQRLVAEIGMLGTNIGILDPVQLEQRLQPICEKIAAELKASRCGFARINMETRRGSG